MTRAIRLNLPHLEQKLHKIELFMSHKVYVPIVATLVSSLLLAWSAWAHQAIQTGDYAIEYHWMHEPPVAGQPNAIVLAIHKISVSVTPLGKLALVAPLDGATIQGDLLPVGVKIESADGQMEGLHWHIYVDGQLLLMPPAAQPAVFLQGIANGPHTIKAVLSGADHQDIGEPAIARVTLKGSSNQAGPIRADLMPSTPSSVAYADVDISGLALEAMYKEKHYGLALGPLAADAPGQYQAQFTPPQVGEYTLRLSGVLGNDQVDATIQLDYVRKPTLIQFLATQFNLTGASLLGPAGWPVITGLSLGLIGLGVQVLRQAHKRVFVQSL
jgi:hypothetical protein